MREFIFEKIAFKNKYVIKEAHQVESYGESGDYYFAYRTDYDSSDYEEAFHNDMSHEAIHSKMPIGSVSVKL